MSIGLFYGCSKKAVRGGEGAALPTEQVGESATGPGEGAEVGMGEAEITGAGLGQDISEGRTSAPMYPIYFDFDRFNIRDDMKGIIEENAQFLIDHPNIMVEIQGNCDERGTNEYNLALGERRAKSAQAYLVNLGVNPDRITTVSFGEERPLFSENSEEAWAKNRRDDFVIIK